MTNPKEDGGISSRRLTLMGVNIGANTHAGLWLERFATTLGGKGDHALHVERLTNAVEISTEYTAHFRRWEAKVKHNASIRTDRATVQGRMVVGLGAESILETSIALHRTYGVPYIPGSALKGLASSAAHRLFGGEHWKNGGECHKIMFGTQNEAGYVTFHDALLIAEKDKQRIPLDLDVMTVHHKDYYGTGKAPPADWDSPNPVAFVTAHGHYLIALEGPEEWTKKAMEILAEALWDEGVGAKTAAGYGRMRLAQTQCHWEKQQAIEAEKRLERERAEAAHKAEEQRQEVERKAEAARREREKKARENADQQIERLKNIKAGDAQHLIETIFANLPDDRKPEAAKEIIKKLDKWLKRQEEQPWAQDVLSAAGKP